MQLLDVAVVRPLKQVMVSELQYIIHTEVHRIQKAEWMSAYVQARAKAFSSSNILSAFSGAGIFPFYPTKVLCRLPEMNQNQTIDTSSASESDSEDLLPLNSILLPSSPVNVSTFNTAK